MIMAWIYSIVVIFWLGFLVGDVSCGDNDQFEYDDLLEVINDVVLTIAVNVMTSS